MRVSGNALPIPQFSIALTDYVDIPFTHGWLQIKGELAHGWLGSNRYLDSYYHGKNQGCSITWSGEAGGKVSS